MSRIDISIIIPVYNAERYLQECIDSILSQSFSNFEIILVNDGSTDNSFELCENYFRKDSRIKLINQQNCGVSVARNKGIEIAAGAWITFVDSDDIMSPNSLNIMYSNATSLGADILKGSIQVILNDSVEVLYKYATSYSKNVVDNIGHAALWGYLFKSSIIKNNNIKFVPGLAYSEDFVFLTNVSIFCKSIATISNYVYLYRRNIYSVCASKDGIKKAKNQFRAAAKLKEMRMNYKKEEKIETFLHDRQLHLMKLGYMSYAANSFSIKTYSLYKQHYLLYFDNKFSLFFHTLWAYMVCLRRKLIRINDDKFTGELGILSKIKKLFNHK